MTKRTSLSIKLLQLPIPEVHHLYTEGNVPLAAGYLKAYALKKNTAQEHEIQIIPPDTVNYGGDEAILNRLLQDNTDVVGFTSYMWNIERNSYLAQRIKEKNPAVTILFGGLEIDAQHPVLQNKYIDAFVLGEGELPFNDFLIDFKINSKPIKRFYRNNTLVNLDDLPNPYLEKVLVPNQKEAMFLETMRGCPYLCKYCFYSKFYSDIRSFPEANLPLLFKAAQSFNVPEIYLMDPSFNVVPQLEKRLALIRRLNTTHIPIHTEIRLEAVTQEIAQSMKEAGFQSVEAGLQSVNEASLAAVSRTWNRDKFIRGAQLLTQQNIDVKTGVMLGLPYDTPEDFERTLDFVIQLGLEESMEIYPLSMIPGTQLRDQSLALGISFMPHPPYWVLSTNYMGHKDLKAAVEMVENKLGIEFFPPVIPRFHNVMASYIHFLDLRQKSGCQIDAFYRYPERVGHSLTIQIDERNDLNEIAELGRKLKQINPFTLVQLVLDRETIPPQEDLRKLSLAFYNSRHYFNHIHHYKIDPQQQYSLRFFHLITHDLETAESYLYQPRYCDLILRYTPALLQKGRNILDEKPILLVDSPIKEEVHEELKQIYEGFENLLILKYHGK